MSCKLSLVRATVADRPRLTTFLHDNYWPYEPMHLAMMHDGSMEPEYGEEEADFTLSSLSQGRTLLAVDGDNLLGVAINGEITTDEYQARANLLANSTDEDWKIFFQFWAYAEQIAGFWVDGEATKALNLETLCVSVKARGRGIGRALVEGSLQVAREEGYTLFRIDSTSYFTARVSEMVGMTCVLSLPFEDYKDENGETVYKVKAPHNALKIFKKKL